MPMYLSGMRPGYRILAGLLMVVVCAALQGCEKTAITDRDLIQQRLQQMAAAVEERQAGAFLEGIQQDFRGQGTLRKANLAGLLLLQFRQHQSISVRFSNVEIELNGEQRATTTLIAHLGGQGGWLGQGRDLRIQSRWLKVDGAWRVERARWQTLP